MGEVGGEDSGPEGGGSTFPYTRNFGPAARAQSAIKAMSGGSRARSDPKTTARSSAKAQIRADAGTIEAMCRRMNGSSATANKVPERGRSCSISIYFPDIAPCPLRKTVCVVTII